MTMLLEARNLCFSYTRRPVWQHLDLSLERGEIVFLRGMNGSGKSTLLRCLAGQLRPREGEVSFLGTPLFSHARKDLAGLSLVPDVPALYDDLTGREHLELIARANGDEEAELRALALAEEFRLFDALDVLPSALSRGMRYKLALTLALAMRPQALLLDEPFAPIVFERNICLPALACEAIADAESPAMRWLRLTDYSLYRELARSTRLARRKRLVRLPLGRCGWKTLVSRAVLVHVRRIESLADILLFAGGYVPLLCALCLGVPSRELLVPAAAVLLMSCRRARELVRVFDADEGNRLVRPLLPVGTLQLLAADSLPALLISIAASCIASIAALGQTGLAPQACAICALIDIATVVCGGISRIALPKAGGRMSFELAFLVVVVAACLASFSGEWLAIVAVLAALVLAGVAAILLGREAIP